MLRWSYQALTWVICLCICCTVVQHSRDCINVCIPRCGNVAMSQAGKQQRRSSTKQQHRQSQQTFCCFSTFLSFLLQATIDRPSEFMIFLQVFLFLFYFSRYNGVPIGQSTKFTLSHFIFSILPSSFSYFPSFFSIVLFSVSLHLYV